MGMASPPLLSPRATWSGMKLQPLNCDTLYNDTMKKGVAKPHKMIGFKNVYKTRAYYKHLQNNLYIHFLLLNNPSILLLLNNTNQTGNQTIYVKSTIL